MRLQVNKKKTISIFQRTCNDDSSYASHHQLAASDFANGRTITFPKSNLFKFSSNVVTTSKYSLLTWAPKSLIWQFRRISNIYFLIVSILSAMPFSPKNPFSMGCTFASVLLFTMIKDGYEDFYRHKQDHFVNSVICHKLDPLTKVIIPVQAKNLQVGDVCLVKSGENFPADMILLSTSNAKGIGYVKTTNLDGESNLKEKISVEATKEFTSTNQLSDLRIEIECDQPNSLFEWNCNFQLFDREKVFLSLKQLLLKGCSLENTQFIYGLIVYTGNDTKIIQNSKKPPSKVSGVLKKMNLMLYTVFLFQISLCFVFSGMNAKQNSDMITHTYLNATKQDIAGTYFIQVLTFLVAYSHLIPISLYVALEVLKLFLAYLINEDLDIYINNSPARCKSSDLIEELGQVEFIFSDKTGTLTSNEMVFRKCYVNGTIHGKIDEEFGKTDSPEYFVVNNKAHREHYKLINFLKFMAVCNTVFPTVDKENNIIYQSSSPDEIALVQSSKRLGIVLADRIDNNLYVDLGEKTELYEILVEIPFSSDRRRMSVIIRHPVSKKIALLTKGADSVMLNRITESSLGCLNSALYTLSIEGLRTLVMGQRFIQAKEYYDWQGRWKKAMLGNNENKEEILEALAEEIEKDLDLVGCSGIEDKLQEGVPETIKTLLNIGIRLWVLTGDKEETAIEIAKSCNMIREDMEIIRLSCNNYQQIEKILQEINNSHLLIQNDQCH